MSISSEDLVQAAIKLNEPELDALVTKLLIVQAKRKAPSVSSAEATLLQQINTPFSPELQHRYNEMIHLRRAEQLSEAQHAELLHLTEQAEAYQTQRIVWLAALAQIRSKTLTQVMADLGITPPEYE